MTTTHNLEKQRQGTVAVKALTKKIQVFGIMMWFFNCKKWLPAETHVLKILTAWNKLTLPEITVCYISRVTKNIPRLHRFTALDGHTSHHRSTLGPSLPLPCESVWEAKRNWTFCGGRCENSMRRPKHRLVTEISLRIVHVILYLYHQNKWSFIQVCVSMGKAYFSWCWWETCT